MKLNRDKVNEEARNIEIDYDLRDYMPNEFSTEEMVRDVLNRLGVKVEYETWLHRNMFNNGDSWFRIYKDNERESHIADVSSVHMRNVILAIPHMINILQDIYYDVSNVDISQIRVLLTNIGEL